MDNLQPPNDPPRDAPDSPNSPGGDAVCQILCAVLRDGIDIHRCQAARALGQIGDAGAAATLIDALIDEDEDVRADVAAALVRMTPGEAAGPLLESLIGDPAADVKAAAIEGLARLNHEEAAPWLRQLVRSRGDGIAWDEDAFYEGGWDDWIDIQVAAIKALAAMNREEAVDDIVYALADEDGQDVTEIAFDALARLGAAGGVALVAFLDDPDPRRRRRAAAAVVNAQGPAIAGGIEHALADADSGVRMAAGAALASKVPDDVRLAALFDDPDAEIRAEAIRLCGEYFPERVAALAENEAGLVRRAAMKLLDEKPGFLSGEKLDRLVRANLDSTDMNTAIHAVSILGRSEGAAEDLLAIATDLSRPTGIRVAALRGLARADAATAVLGDEDRQVRIEALTILEALAKGSDWPNPAGETLLSALEGTAVEYAPEPPAEPSPAGEDDEPIEASVPVSTLTAITTADRGPGPTETDGDTEVQLTQSDLDFLELTKRSTARRVVGAVEVPAHADVPRLAARILGDIAHPEVAQALADRLTGDDDELRLAATESLARIGNMLGGLPEDVIEKLLDILEQGDARLRLGAVRALGTSASKFAVSALPAYLEDPDCLVRAEAITTLAKLGETGPWPASLLIDPDPPVRLAAAKAIAEATEPDRVERLVDFAFSFAGHHCRATAGLLRAFDADAASRAFCDVLEDQTRVREWPVAIEALGELNGPQ
jgi:HEAT repeat protein